MGKQIRLRKKQKEALLQWIAEGLETDEINQRAANFRPIFEVTRAQVDYYRSTRKIDLDAIKSVGESDALRSGLALKAERVKQLQILAALLWKDLIGGFLWLDQVKGLGSGEFMQVIDYEEFNAAEVKEYRGTLDDIAKEMGHRKTIIEANWRDIAKQRGHDPEQIFNDMVAAARRRMAESSGAGSIPDSAEPDRGGVEAA